MSTYTARHRRAYEKNRARIIARNLARYHADRPGYLFRRYGLLPQDLEALEVRSGQVCEICGKPPTGRQKCLRVDHDHVTKEVRGLLCNQCNLDLHAIERGPDWIEKALAYLRRPGVKTMQSLIQSRAIPSEIGGQSPDESGLPAGAMPD